MVQAPQKLKKCRCEDFGSFVGEISAESADLFNREHFLFLGACFVP